MLIGPFKGSEGGGLIGSLTIYFVFWGFGAENKLTEGREGFKRFLEAVAFVLAKFELKPFELKLGQNESYGLQEPFQTPPGPL